MILPIYGRELVGTTAFTMRVAFFYLPEASLKKIVGCVYFLSQQLTVGFVK